MSFKLSAVLAALILGLLLGFSAAWKWQSSRVDAITAEYKGFIEAAQALGDAAQKEAAEREARDKVNKTKADNENKLTLDTLRADIKRLRNARASSNYLPSAAPGASHPELACFDRAELESAVQRFDDEVTAIVSEGDEARVNLDTARQWAQP